MKDLNYSSNTGADTSESVLRINFSTTNTNNNHVLLSCHDIETTKCVIFLGEPVSKTPEKCFGVARPLPALPFFVTNYLENGPDTDCHDTSTINKGTELHQAMGYFGYTRVNMLRLLLEKGIDINAQDKHGNTALHLAVKSSESLKETVVRLLLQYNIDVNIKNLKGLTALHLASRNGHEAIVSELLNKKAKIGIRENLGKTALHLAAKYEHNTIVKILLANQANINAQDLKGLTALHIAGRHEDLAVMKRLLLDNRANIGIQDVYGRTVLHIAIRSKDRAKVELLLEKGANTEIADRNGNTPHILDIHYHLETLLSEARQRNE